MDTETPLWERLDEPGEYRELARTRLEHVVRIAEPMLLCSQIQRSGGTLFSRLFDGHPEVHAHPHELKIGPKDRWPKLDLEAPGTWFEALYEEVGGQAPAGRLEQARAQGDGRRRLPVPVPAGDSEAALPRVCRAAGDRAPARRPRLLLHGVLQRLDRQPEPLHRAQEAADGVRDEDEPAPEERRAVLPGLSRRLAGDDRPRAARLVRVGLAPPGAVRGSRGRDGALARLGDGGGRRTSSATATARSCSRTRSWSGTRRGRCGGSPGRSA